MRVDARGWLECDVAGRRVLCLPSVRTTPLGPAGALGLVWHATGGVGGPGHSERLARRVQTYSRGVDRPASWHVLIGRDGSVYQSASLLVGTWHTGRPGVVTGQRFPNVNAATIGVELENAGRLEEVAGRAYAWPYWRDAGRRCPAPRCALESRRVESYEGTPYDSFPEAQLGAAVELVAALASFFRWTREAFGYGHSMFAAPVKTDPGRLWMEHRLPQVLDEVFSRKRGASVQAERITSATAESDEAGRG